MSDGQQFTIKAKCKGVIRLLKIPTDVSFQDLYDLLKNSFGITDCQLRYSDEEGDLIELGSQDELQEALKVAKTVSPLKIIVATDQNPSMIAAMNKPRDLMPKNANHVDEADRMNANSGRNPNPLVKQSSGLTVIEKPTPKPRPSRKRLGFYTTLCTDMSSGEMGKSDDENDRGAKKEAKKPKKNKHLQGSKYYASLANDIANMTLAQSKEEKQEQRETKRKNSVKRKETAPEQGVARRENVKEKVKKVEKDLGDLSLSDEEPPKWFNKVVTKMSESVSSQVIGALNGAVIASTVSGSSPKPAKRETTATCVHDGIICNGCQQIIVGPRYKCGNCPNYDLCEQCEVIEDIHDSSHVFLKLRYPSVGIGRKHGVMIPLLKDIIYKSKDFELAEEQDKKMREVRKKLKQLAKKKREEQVGKKKADKKMKKLQKPVGVSAIIVKEDYDLAVLGDENYPDGTEVTAELEFRKRWTIKNTGTNAWKDVKLKFLYGCLRCLTSDEVELPKLQPGQEGTAMVTFFAPPDIGEYISAWRAVHDGKNFGQKVCCKIKVVGKPVQSEDDDIYEDANDTTVAPAQESPVEAASQPVAEVMEDQNTPGAAEHDNVFHAYTIQETHEVENSDTGGSSFDNQAITSEVPEFECNELEWDTCVLNHDNLLVVNEDDSQDIEVISNASSEDYCVVPLPACFNPDIPLNIEDFEDPLEFCVERPASNAQEINNEVNTVFPVGSEDDDQQAEMRNIEPAAADDPTDNEDEIGPSGEEVKVVKVISIIPELPTSPDVPRAKSTDNSGQRGGPERATSVPINIAVNATERSDQHPLTMPGFDVRSTISEPYSPQPPSVERTPLVPGRIPASPPGRAVPVIQAKAPEPRDRQDDSEQGPYEVCVENGSTDDQGHWQAVRTQPPDVILAQQVSIEETVTIQPQGASGASSQSSNQGTAQLAANLATGTLRRAFDTITDTFTSFVTGKEPSSVVVYTSNGNGDGRNAHGVPEPTQPQTEPQRAGSDKGQLMSQLHDMGFCNRPLNERLLRKYNMDVRKVVVELLQESDNDWQTARH